MKSNTDTTAVSPAPPPVAARRSQRRLNADRPPHFRKLSWQRAIRLALVATSALLVAASAEPLASPAVEPAPTSQTIPWTDHGAKATAQYSGDALAVGAAEDGEVRLRCAFQRLEGEVTREGLWLTSTVDATARNRFRVVADSVGCDGGPMVALPESGVTSAEPGLARYVRRGLAEEYSVSVDGVRQDLVVPERPGGAGPLRVELAVSGARAEAAANGARLVLAGSGRKLVYSRLRVVDSTERELGARLEVVSDRRLAVVAEDVEAAYPVRIDPTFSDENWVSMGGLPGANGEVEAAVVDASGTIYIGGDFTNAGGIPANYVAKWDGHTWSALGDGVGGRVHALALSEGNLYAGGEFTAAGGAPANYVARWDGAGWSALGSGVDNSVNALAVSGGTLYVGGTFYTAGATSAYGVARWDGTVWSPLSEGVGGSVYALAVYDTNLYVGGYFFGAGGTPANHVAKWNGSAWSALGEGPDFTVLALAVSDSGVYAGGWFATVGGSAANNIAKWDGSAWSALGSGVNDSVRALALSGADLYAGGKFTSAGGVSANRIAKWSAATGWSALGSGVGSLNTYVNALTVVGTDLYAGGKFTSVGGVSCRRIARWDGSAWSPVGSALNGSAYAVAVSGTTVYVGGDFSSAGGQTAKRIAKWDGYGWSALGSGMNGKVNTLAAAGTDLYAGGEFTTAGGIAANYVAKWDGSTWSALDSGMDSYGYVNALAVSGTDLYAGGNFTKAGETAAFYIAKWNGSTWSALGAGLNNSVNALVVSGTNLYAAGGFSQAGSTVAWRVAKWEGSAWSALGEGIQGTVNALAVCGGDLYAGGNFTSAGGTAANHVAKWNGSTWSALGPGMSQYGYVYALAVSGTDLYAGGDLTSAGGAPANRIAKWDGSTWSALGSGVNSRVYALVTSGTDLYAAGWFDTAGGKSSAYVAKAMLALDPGVAPSITTQPRSRTNDLGTTASFSVVAAGTVPLSYQWLRDDVPLANGGNISGAASGTLTLANVQSTDAGNFRVVISNAYGSATSAVAALTISLPAPLILDHPKSQIIAAGATANFSVTAAGTAPFSYRWQKNGLPLTDGGDVTGAATNALALANVQASDMGNYRVIVTDAYGSVTSAVAVVTVWHGPIATPAEGWVVAWGDNSAGQTDVPAGLTNLMAISAGGSHNLALRRGDALIAWGGYGEGATNVSAAVSNVMAIAAGLNHSLALRSNGTVVEWNSSGNLMTIPDNLSNIVAIAVGGSHTLALRSNGAVAAWGYNGSGQTAVPAGLSNVVAIAAGGAQSLALRSDGTVVAWGSNSNGATNVPAGLEHVVAIAAGGSGDSDGFNLALRADGTVVAWGSNWAGQTDVPIGLSNVVAIAAGGSHALALRADRTAVAWGYNEYGQTTVPVWLTNVAVIAAGGRHSLALAGASGPILLAQPESAVSTEGLTVTFTVTATGSPPLAYQWRFNDVDLPGASSPSVTLTNVRLAQAGNYTVRVTNAIGAVLSQAATLTVLPGTPPSITGEPQDLTVALGGTATFVVAATGNPQPVYQWHWNDTAIPDATNATLVLRKLATNQGGGYSVVVSNALGVATSRSALLTISPLLTLREALDDPNLTWTTSTNTIWFAQTGVTHDGVDAAQAGPSSDSGESFFLETSVTGPGTLRFWWRGDTNSDGPFFSIDNEQSQPWPLPTTGWEPRTFLVPPGPHTLRWTLYNYTIWPDTAWLDEVSYVPDTVMTPELLT